MKKEKLFQNKDILKNKKGITLIALVISIIVMLILAGVSLNATIGENGIMAQAKNATYMQSIAILEEFLQQQYIEKYDNISQYENKLDGLIADSQIRNYFQKSMIDSYYFIDSNNYKEYYLIEKKALPDEIKNQLRGGDTSISGNGIYADFTDVYGITSDLKVYYCSNGLETRIGAIDDAKESNMSSKIVINASNNWSSALGYNRDVTLEDLRSQTELTITENNLDLKQLAFFGSLEKITFKNVSYDSLDGVEDAPNLYYVFFSGDCKIEDYKGIGKISNLKYLYLWNSSDREVEKIFSEDKGIASFEISTLQYLAISYGDARYICGQNYETTDKKVNEKVTNISALNQLNDVTKKAIKYISLENNCIESIEALKEFSNVYLLKVRINKLVSLSGIENMNNLTYLIADNNMLGTNNEDKDKMNIEKDSLSSISKVDISNNDIKRYVFTSNMPNLYSVDLSYNENLVWCNYLKPCNNITKLNLEGCKNLNEIAVENIKEIFNNCTDKRIDSKYTLCLLDDNISSIDLTGLEIEKEIFESLKQYSNVKSFNMKNTKVVNNKVEISKEELNTIVNGVLSNYSEATYIGLEGVENLNDISFVKNTRKLRGLDLRKTGVTTEDETIGLQLLNNNAPNLKVLLISNENIDLSKIQQCINKLDSGSGSNTIFGSNDYGLVCYSNVVLKTLENCTEVTQIKMCYQSTGAFISNMDLDLTKCSKLKSFIIYHVTFGIVKLPENVEVVRHLVQGNSKIDASSCKKLTEVEFSQNQNFIYFLNTVPKNIEVENIIVSGIDVQILLDNIDKIQNLNNLKKIAISNVSWSNVKLNISSLNNLKNIPNLESLKIDKVDVNDDDFSVISNLINLNSLTITNTNLKDITFISNLVKLQKADLSNNQIVKGIYSLQYLTNLEKLNLSNNAIFDISSNEGKNYKNLEILAGLNYANNGKLKELYLKGNNNITDWSLVSNCSWPNGKSGF